MLTEERLDAIFTALADPTRRAILARLIVGDATVTELAEPFSELLLQLTMWTNVVHNKEQVEQLGADYGVKALDGTGPWCFVSWTPRSEDRSRRPFETA